MATPRGSHKPRFLAIRTHRNVGTMRQSADWRGGWEFKEQTTYCVHRHESKNKALLCAQEFFLIIHKDWANDDTR